MGGDDHLQDLYTDVPALFKGLHLNHLLII